MREVIGLDVGGTKLLARFETEAGGLLGTFRRASGRRTDPDAVLEVIVALVEECRASNRDVAAIGIGFPGLIDRFAGHVLSSVMLDGWHDVPFAMMVQQRTGLACAIDNDVNNAARAEISARPSGSYTDMLFVSVGTGIGGAIVQNGRITHGARGFAGEIGHVCVAPNGPACHCGRRGCVGYLAGGASIAGKLGLTADEFAAAARRKDQAAIAMLEEAAEMIGRAVGTALNLLNPDLVVLAGGVAESGNDFLRLVAEKAQGEALREIANACRFERALAGYDAGAKGAAQLARAAMAADERQATDIIIHIPPPS